MHGFCLWVYYTETLPLLRGCFLSSSGTTTTTTTFVLHARVAHTHTHTLKESAGAHNRQVNRQPTNNPFVAASGLRVNHAGRFCVARFRKCARARRSLTAGTPASDRFGTRTRTTKPEWLPHNSPSHRDAVGAAVMHFERHVVATLCIIEQSKPRTLVATRHDVVAGSVRG